MKVSDKAIVIICVLIFLLVLMVCVFSLLLTSVDYDFECNSGDIDMEFYYNQSDLNNTYIKINGIDGLYCKGSGNIPVYAFKEVLE